MRPGGSRKVSRSPLAASARATGAAPAGTTAERLPAAPRTPARRRPRPPGLAPLPPSPQHRPPRRGPASPGRAGYPPEQAGSGKPASRPDYSESAVPGPPLSIGGPVRAAPRPTGRRIAPPRRLATTGPEPAAGAPAHDNSVSPGTLSGPERPRWTSFQTQAPASMRGQAAQGRRHERGGVGRVPPLLAGGRGRIGGDHHRVDPPQRRARGGRRRAGPASPSARARRRRSRARSTP